jgi:hypothetical protein
LHFGHFSEQFGNFGEHFGHFLERFGHFLKTFLAHFMPPTRPGQECVARGMEGVG